MFSTVISNSCALYGDYGNYGPPPYPRKNIRPRASLRHNTYNPYRPYLRRVDTRVSLANPNKISRTTSRGQYVTMPVHHPKLHPLPVSQRIIQSQHKARQTRSAERFSSYDTSSWVEKGSSKPSRGKKTQNNATSSSSKSTGDKRHKSSSSNGRQHHRYFTKDGMCRGSSYSSKNKMCDLIGTLVDLKYSWILFVFTLCYIVTWAAFAELYFLGAWLRGDMEHIQDPQWQPCFEKLDSFHSALSISMDSQIINGYGSRVASANCMDGLVLMMAQSIIESVLDTLMLGCILAKLAKPKRRLPTLLFSQHCVVSERDERLCLMFNVKTLKETHMLVAEIRAKLIKSHHTKEGEFILLEQRELTLGMGPDEARLFTVEPQTVEHVIDEQSPLWGISADSLKWETFEIVVMVDGAVQDAGTAFHVRTSYTEDEIFWGQRFKSHKPLAERGIGSNHKTSDKNYKVQTATHSDREMAVRQRHERSPGHDTDSVPSNMSTRKVHYQYLSDQMLLCNSVTNNNGTGTRKLSKNEFFI
ncbi:G protein-activated inward rectifier potassium channel 3-like [Salvelinus sp. IW2-2015]|uniref:G protein-activated inward rectifier potassium channel 3-like n=1 Tax=Salvelinus sp. IW2-2015 TaxID=2691554 RepID=UPI0038D36F16